MLSVHAALLLAAACGPETPPVWPRRFTLVQRRVPDASASVSLATTVTFYDADRGANLIQITPDANASDVVWDLELDSRLSYYFTPSTGQCKEIAMPVGVLRPTWLSNATFLGRKRVNGRDCLAYTKADFIDYYADATTCEPVSWYFHTMRARFDSVFWAPGLAVPNASWLAPPRYCREEASPEPVAAAGAAEREGGGLPTARGVTFAPVRDQQTIPQLSKALADMSPEKMATDMNQFEKIFEMVSEFLNEQQVFVGWHMYWILEGKVLERVADHKRGAGRADMSPEKMATDMNQFEKIFEMVSEFLFVQGFVGWHMYWILEGKVLLCVADRRGGRACFP